MDAVVNVFCRKRLYSLSSSGLTNSHSAEHYSQVMHKKHRSDAKYLATVLAIGTEGDIALLTVNDDGFLKAVSHIEFGELPALQDAVTVVGFPIGGDDFCDNWCCVTNRDPVLCSWVH
ncbi:hypothetical protein P3X46_023356 [Hevea brasiliensis]|uniref:Uncharacterized protein n=1 Tax=Hevea brasiliensis TaxID=3981 RepID=A0ABQ9LAS7_HEVBR|nr:hypothetical protein P3X46_023356 [Hevea brasiliensis]